MPCNRGSALLVLIGDPFCRVPVVCPLIIVKLFLSIVCTLGTVVLLSRGHCPYRHDHCYF